MSDNSEHEDGGNAEQLPDYANETVEQLEARFRAGEGVIREQPEEAVEPEVEQAVEETVEAEAAEEAQPGQESEETDEEFDERQSLIEELKIQLEKERINAAKLQHLQSRDAGLVGHLKKEMEALKAAITQPASEEDLDYSAEPQRGQPRFVQTPGTEALQSRLAELENSARAGAIEAEYAAFIAAKNLDGEKASEFIKSMGSSIAEQWEPYREQVGSMSAASLRKSLRFVLDSAYADLRLSELKSKREEAIAKRASQVPERKKAKLASATSGSGSVAGAPKGPKKLSDMTAEEADAELLRQFGTQKRSGRIRML